MVSAVVVFWCYEVKYDTLDFTLFFMMLREWGGLVCFKAAMIWSSFKKSAAAVCGTAQGVYFWCLADQNLKTCKGLDGVMFFACFNIWIQLEVH